MLHQNRTILVVEDDPIIRESVCDYLQFIRPTWEVAQAGNGHEGLQLAQTVGFDLILTDLHMPVMDGYEMVLSLQKNPTTRAIPLILNTSEDLTCPCVMRLKTICRAVIFKPLLFSQLGDTLDLILPAPTAPELGHLSGLGVRCTHLPRYGNRRYSAHFTPPAPASWPSMARSFGSTRSPRLDRSVR